ncbi:hypothetical protein TNCV_4340981 [Trichonephila clavipes]|nr:hypothetical protein TNCV_4340981 [Trichonephila clavipes]
MIVRQVRTAPIASLSTIKRTIISSIHSVVPSTVSWRLSETSVFDPTTLAEPSGGVSQPIVMVAIRVAECSAVNPALLLKQMTIVSGETGASCLNLPLFYKGIQP